MAAKKLAVLLDLSGTLHVEDTAIPGAIEALRRLMSNEKYAVKFVTNTTKVCLTIHAQSKRVGAFLNLLLGILECPPQSLSESRL